MKNFKVSAIKKIGFIIFLISLMNESKAQVVINEYSCSNLSTFICNLGTYEDWIELYNTTSTPVNLNNYCLSDKKTNLSKWKFGNVTIAGNGFLRIWASGYNVNTGINLHTNFTLSQCKYDNIIFSNAALVVQDSLTTNPAQLAHSRGRTTNGAATWSVFKNPTPNTSNNTATPFQNYATTLSMNVAPGFYGGAQSVTITTPDPSITIRYTTNGTTPTGGSTVYSGPVSITTTKVLRAIAISSVASIPNSFVTSNTYFINAPHTVAVISIFGDQVLSLLNNTGATNPTTGIEYFDSSGTFRTEGYGSTNKHGNDSWGYNQRGIDFVNYDDYGYADALHHRFYNMKTRKNFQRIILKASANDNYPFECPSVGTGFGDPTLLDGAHIRDQYVQTVAQKAGLHVDSRTWAPCVMYVNGQYWGVYDLREKLDDKDFTKYYYNTTGDSLQMLQTWGSTWSAYGGVQAQTDWNTLANYVVSNNMAIPANYNHVDSLYNVKSLADYVILNSYCVTSDWLNWNTEWWRGNNVNSSKKKWRYCLWDEDATFSHYINYTGVPSTGPNANPCDPQSLGDPGGQGHVPILNALLQNPTFKQYYVLRYFDLINTGLSCARMTAILDSMVLQIAPEMPGQIARWGGSISAWQQNVLDLRNFILQRCDSVKQQFDSCYNTTGPFLIKVNVDPPGSGTVDFNSLHLTNFIWSGQYPGNITIGLLENPNPGYCFSNWEFKNHTPFPNTTSAAITVSLITTDSIVAHFVPIPVPTVTPVNPTFCAGDSVQLNASGYPTFTWTPASGLSCTTCSNPIASPTVTTTYTVSANNGSCIATQAILVIVNQSPVLSPIGSQIVCSGAPVGAINYSAGTANVNWTNTNTGVGIVASGTGNITGYTAPVVVTQQTGVITATPTGNPSGCVGLAQTYSVIINPVPSSVGGIADTAKCGINIGGVHGITVSGGTPSYSYQWYNGSVLIPGATSSTLTGVAGGTYSVQIKDASGCTVNVGTTTFTVIASSAVVAAVTPPLSQGEAPFNVTFVNNTSGATLYNWNFGNGTSSSLSTPGAITYNIPGTYTVILYANSGNGCIDTATALVIIEAPPVVPIPNVFSPNGDGINDYFQPAPYGATEFTCTMYDRWGKIVYEFSGVNDKWNGQTTHGGACPDGTYYYVIKAKDISSKLFERKGFIQLLR